MIAVIVPTIRPKCFQEFSRAWSSLFKYHAVELIAVNDQEVPSITYRGKTITLPDILEEGSRDLIFNFNDGVRNLGFYYALKYLPKCDTLITLDDDTSPLKDVDAIAQHLDILRQKVSTTWMLTASRPMRGFPYEVRNEATVAVSHGVWEGIKDYDAPTQLVCGNKDVTFVQAIVPKGAYIPVCGMNLAWTRETTDLMYFSPMGKRVGVHRFADIWMGVFAKKALDQNGKALATGYARISHMRRSNVFTNLQQEAKGILWNESFWKGTFPNKEAEQYFKQYAMLRERWKELIGAVL